MAADIRFPLERANGVQTVKTAAALARAGRDVRLVVRDSDPRSTAEILALYGLDLDPRLSVLRLGVMHQRGAFALPRLLFLARTARAARAAADRGDVVFTRDLQLADLLLKLRTRRVVYEAHAVEHVMYEERGALYGTTETADPNKTARLRAREQRVWRGAAGLVTTTAGIRDAFAAAFGPRERVCVVANGGDVPEDRTFPGLASGGLGAEEAERVRRSPQGTGDGLRPAPEPDNPPRVLYAGQLYPWKGVDVLLDAMAGVPDAQLVILGGLEGERDLARVRARVAELGLAPRTTMPGTVPQAQVAAELTRAHVVAVPFLLSRMTERHTSPIKAFEAMAAGRPIVASDTPATREILRDGESALLVPPGDAAALRAAIARLLADRALAERLARTAWDDSVRHSWAARAQALCTLFDEVAA
jgi:glycosyltransferase involved in cell wall biosynthesis